MEIKFQLDNTERGLKTQKKSCHYFSPKIYENDNNLTQVEAGELWRINLPLRSNRKLTL